MDASILGAVIGVISGTVSAVASTYLAFRLRFERFEARIEERETQVQKWRQSVDTRIGDFMEWRQRFVGEHGALLDFRDEWRQANADRLAMHTQNQAKLEKVSERLSHVEGTLSGRFPRPKVP